MKNYKKVGKITSKTLDAVQSSAKARSFRLATVGTPSSARPARDLLARRCLLQNSLYDVKKIGPKSFSNQTICKLKLR